MRILFIDDDEILHRTIGDFLEKHGYEVIYAYSGKNGLDLFSENKIDLVITDIFLPDYGGIKVLKIIKELDECAEVIFITGYGDLQTARSAVRYGASEYLLKPIDLTELLTCIENTEAYKSEVLSKGNQVEEILNVTKQNL
ncbi:MAG: response regulator [Candidatus Aureabacteria bacterium]|nr:response regulator [Candidatus Auribacterota bacterium]